MTLLDLAIITVYMAGIVIVGIRYRGKQEDIRDYFTAKDGFTGIVGTIMVGLSLGATLFSGLSFVAFPSVIYTYGVTALTAMVGYPMAYFALRYWFLPRYLAQAQVSPYDIIEERYGRPVRLASSIMFVLLRLCWMAALIYAPVVVIMACCGLDDSWLWPLVLVIGLSSTFYTAIGGIRGVIVTDAIQFLLIMAVLIVTILFILLKIPLTMAEVSNYLQSNTGLLTLNWSLDPTVAMTVWAMAIGGTMQNMSSFTADQMSLQRYLASGSVKAASSAFGTSMLTTSIVLLLLSGVGLTLGAWYSLHPDPAMPADADKVFPHFVATQLPVGFMGMVIAAILAATMSSITSGINALSGSLLNDFSALSERIEAKRLLNWARWTSVGIGVLATLVAGFVDGMGSLFDIMNAFYGIFLGPLLACMFCTVSRLRLNGWGLITGMVAGCIFGIWVAYSSLANLWVSLYSAIMTVIIAWVATLILGKSPAKQR
jgi:sodium-coupled monocarboxylate transporter 8/12